MELVGLYLDKEPIHFDEGCMPAFADWQRWLNGSSLLMLLKTGTSFSRASMRGNKVVEQRVDHYPTAARSV